MSGSSPETIVDYLVVSGKTEKDEKSHEVLFDEPFMGGQSLR